MCSGHSELTLKKSDVISTFKKPVGRRVHSYCMIGAFQADILKSNHIVSGEIPRKPWLGPGSLSTGSSSRSFLLAPWRWRLRGVSRNAYSLPILGGPCGLSPAMALLYLLTYLGEGSQQVSWASVCCCQSHPTRTLSGAG